MINACFIYFTIKLELTTLR